jgi:hypothetical protein
MGEGHSGGVSHHFNLAGQLWRNVQLQPRHIDISADRYKLCRNGKLVRANLLG